MNTLTRTGIAGLALLLGLLMAWASGAGAQERKAYRHVDAAGNVTYSQTPPVHGADTRPVDITPAQRGRGGYVDSYSPYENPRYYAALSAYERRAAAPAQPSARDQRLAAVKAECERQRGVDCNNPATIQYLDSTSIPGRGRHHR